MVKKKRNRWVGESGKRLRIKEVREGKGGNQEKGRKEEEGERLRALEARNLRQTTTNQSKEEVKRKRRE